MPEYTLTYHNNKEQNNKKNSHSQYEQPGFKYMLFQFKKALKFQLPLKIKTKNTHT
jgi:hypothetical protein